MKKTLVTILFMAMVATTFVGCGGNENGSTGGAGSQTENQANNGAGGDKIEIIDPATKYDNDTTHLVEYGLPKKLRSKIFDGEPEYSTHDEHFWYDVYADCVEVNYLGGLGETVELPCEFDGKPVRGIGMFYYVDKDLIDKESTAEVKTVIMPDTYWVIDYSGFGEFTSLEKVEISENVVYIAGDAFIRCTSLKELTLPASVLHIGSRVWQECENLEVVYSYATDIHFNNDTFVGGPIDDLTYLE